MEKSPAAKANGIARALLDYAQDATMVMVLSPALVIGPAAYQIVSGSRMFAIRAMPYWKMQPVPAHTEVRRLMLALRGAELLPPPLGKFWDFFVDVFKLRATPSIEDGDNQSLTQMMLLATVASGGVPRVFLQLLQDAATYAALANQSVPNLSNLQDAMKDQTDSLALLLREGDAQALSDAFGTNGLEVPLERKLRFFAHGLLLEYELPSVKVVYPAPLLTPFLRF